MKNILTLKNVTVAYKNKDYHKDALHSLNLEIVAGEVFGFLGPNGAGKTTTIKAILNLLYPREGEIRIFNGLNTDYKLHRRLGYMPEIANYYWYLSPRELLIMYAGFFGIGKKQAGKKINGLFKLVGIEQEADVLMKNFSKGMMQKVSLAQALINDPELLILDEPASGLDPVARMKVRDIIYDLKTQGKTVFFSSHELSEAELICDRVGILHKGQMLKVETMQNILERKDQNMSLERYFLSIIKGE